MSEETINKLLPELTEKQSEFLGYLVAIVEKLQSFKDPILVAGMFLAMLQSERFDADNIVALLAVNKDRTMHPLAKNKDFEDSDKILESLHSALSSAPNFREISKGRDARIRESCRNLQNPYS